MRQFIALSVAVAFAALLCSTAAHPTRYPRHPKPDCKAAAPILSYHVHIVFGFNQYDTAIAVRNRTIERFKYEYRAAIRKLNNMLNAIIPGACSAPTAMAATTTAACA
jgi:hypothetical protein